jgi:hypothetical protein
LFGELDLLGLVEELDDVRCSLDRSGSNARMIVVARNLPDWSISTCEQILLRDVDFDPRAALGDDPRLMQLLFAGLHFDFEVDARGTVELRHDDALGTVHDELAAAEHDRDVAEVDVLFDRLLLLEAHADLQTHRVGALQRGGSPTR